MLIIGLKFFSWIVGQTEEAMHCSQCGFSGNFNRRKGMRFITLFFIIPTIPVSGFSHITECTSCKTRYQENVA